MSESIDASVLGADAGPMTTGTVATLRVGPMSKTFGTAKVLQDAHLEVLPGEVHAIVGANGSGKSTLIKTLAGFHAADPGSRAWLGDEELDLTAATGAHHDRLRFVHQDLGLVLELGAMDNLALHHGFHRRWLGTIDWGTQSMIAQRELSRFGVDIDLGRPLAEASMVQRVVVAVVAALQGWEGGNGVLVLDEPTAVLPQHEVDQLFDLVREVQRTGTSVIYVSHRIDEIFRLCDRVSVMRGGRIVATESIAEISPNRLATLMSGSMATAEYRAAVKVPSATAEVALRARNVKGRRLRGVDLEVRRGEILGVTGLAGSGAEDIPYILSGSSTPVAEGQVQLPARSDEWFEVGSSPRLPIVPADRTGEGVIGGFSVAENVTVSILDRLRSRVGQLSGRSEGSSVARWMSNLSIRAAGPDAPVAALSGGNQQKVVLARCLAQDPDVLLLCEPTAGVDIATRISIYDLIAAQASRGLAVVVSSTDEGDLLAMCTRVLVVRDGLVVSEMPGSGLDKTTIIHALEGTESA